MITAELKEYAIMGKHIYILETGYRSTTGGPVVVTGTGKILWFTSGPELPNDGLFHLNRIEARESYDNGRSWGEARVVLQGRQEHFLGMKGWAPQPSAVLLLPSGKLLFFGARYGGYSWADHDFNKSLNEGFIISSSDNGCTWSKPRALPGGERYLSSVLSACLMTTRRIVYPFGYMVSEPKGCFVVSVVYSDDEGETWCRSSSILRAGNGGFESGACEPSVAELPDGRLWMLIRAQTGFQWESFSSDGGVTWEDARPSRFVSSNSPAVLLRLSSGRLVVAWNNSSGLPYARQSLVMAASDDGRKFFGFREIAHTDYPMTNAVTYWGQMYPYLAETPDGHILISFNHGNWNFNRAMMARIHPDWLEERGWNEDFSDGRAGWCNLGATGDRMVAPGDDRPGASLRLEHYPPGPCGIIRNFPLLSKGEMQVEMTVHKPEAYLLWHDSFLVPGRETEAVARARFGMEGKVFFGAGNPVEKSSEQKESRQAPYFYLAYPVEKETLCQQRIKLGERFILRLRCDAAAGKASLRINDGPEVSATIGDIFGLCWIGLVATADGALELRSIRCIQGE